MSSILKALRRVEDEAAEEAARALRDEVLASPHGSPAATPARPRSGVRALSLALALLALFALGVALGRSLGAVPPARVAANGSSSNAPGADSPAPHPVAPEAFSTAPPLASAPPAPAPAPSAPSAPSAPPAPPAPPAQLEPLPLGNAPPSAPRVTKPPVLAVVAPPLPPPTESFVDEDDAPEPARSEPALPEPAVSGRDRSLDEASPAGAAAPRDPPVPPAAQRLQRPAAAPQRLAVRPAARPASSSAPRVESTIWHPDSDRRRAIVENGAVSREVREGETVGGYLVLAIGPTGVVFRRDGNDVARRVGQR